MASSGVIKRRPTKEIWFEKPLVRVVELLKDVELDDPDELFPSGPILEWVQIFLSKYEILFINNINKLELC